MEGVSVKDRIRCAKKGIVVMDLFSRIMQDLIKVKERNVNVIRERVEKNLHNLPNDKERKLADYQLKLIEETDIREWDVSLCMAVVFAAKLQLNGQEKDFAGRIVKEKNRMMHGTCFCLNEEGERKFYGDATEVANFFQIRLTPTRSYIEELNGIKEKDLNESQSAEIIQRIQSEEQVAEVPQSTEETKLCVGRRFEEHLANSGNEAHLVLKLPSSKDEEIDQWRSWFKTHGKNCTIGSHVFEVLAVETGCIAVYITVSTLEIVFYPEKIYAAVICYVRKAFDFSGTDPKTIIEILMFFDDTKII